MTQSLYGNVAPLKNVAALLALIDRLENRVPGLPGMATLYGPSGRGKSTACTAATNHTTACHIEVQPLWRAKSLLEGIAKHIGVVRLAHTASKMFDQVAEVLLREQRPLLLDEADRLMKDEMIEVVRGLHEASGAPIILIGEEELPTKMLRWERMHGRMLDWVAVQPADMTDLKQLATIYAPGIEIADDLRAKILEVSRYSHRYVSNNLARVAEDAVKQGISKIAAADWKGAFFSGEAPPPRREVVVELARQRLEAKAVRPARSA